MGNGYGPVAVLEKTIKELGLEWGKDPWHFRREGKIDLHLGLSSASPPSMQI